MDATNAPHNNTMPDCDKMFIVRNKRGEIVSGVTVVLIANNAKNATIHSICNVVLIFPIAKRVCGTGISIFCVPRNSRSPLTYNSRAIIMMIGIMINQKRIINANMINVFATNNLSPMWSNTPPSFVQQSNLRAKNPSNQSLIAPNANSINDTQYHWNINVGIIANAAQIRNIDKKFTNVFMFFSPLFFDLDVLIISVLNENVHRFFSPPICPMSERVPIVVMSRP